MPTTEELAAKLKETEGLLQIAKNEKEAARLKAENTPFSFVGLNNAASILAAIAASLGAVFAGFNNLKIGEIETRKKIEEPSYAYVKEVLVQLGSDTNVKNDSGQLGMKLQALKIVAQASSSEKGLSNADDRALLPLTIALLMDQSGTLASMDSELKYLDRWVDIAKVDPDDQTRLTAMTALMRISEKAYQEKDIKQVSRCVKKLDELLELLPTDANGSAARTNGYAILALLSQFFNDNAARASTLNAGDKQILASIKNQLSDAVVQTQEMVVKLKSAQSDSALDVSSVTKSQADQLVSLQTEKALAVADRAIDAASQSALATTPQATLSEETSPESADIDITPLMEKLVNADAKTSHQARAAIALYRQAAVKSLVLAIKKLYSKGNLVDDRARVGVASALRLMQQPIVLDNEQAYWVVSLLQSKDKETRVAVSDFLMNLESEVSVRNCFDELEKLFYASLADVNEYGSAAYDTALIVGTWARNITSDTASRKDKVSFRDLALGVAKEWKDLLKNTGKPASWSQTIDNLEELIYKAEKLREKEGRKIALTPPLS